MIRLSEAIFIFKYECALYFDRDNWQIYKKVQKWTTGKAAKSFADMQGDKVYMLTKKSRDLDIVGY